jgi:hypothetical protein
MNKRLSNIRPQWQRVAARMQHVAGRTQGYAVMSIQILLDSSGNPRLWFEPTMKLIEPRSACSDGDALHEFLQDIDIKAKI